jgi:hypothetical protein
MRRAGGNFDDFFVRQMSYRICRLEECCRIVAVELRECRRIVAVELKGMPSHRGSRIERECRRIVAVELKGMPSHRGSRIKGNDRWLAVVSGRVDTLSRRGVN